jgi:hypothetical protein
MPGVSAGWSFGIASVVIVAVGVALVRLRKTIRLLLLPNSDCAFPSESFRRLRAQRSGASCVLASKSF